MHGYHSSFPAGGAGAGLLLLRLAVAAHLLHAALDAGRPLPCWWQVLLALTTGLLLLGLLTPLAAGAAAAGQLPVLADPQGTVAAIGIVCALALLLLGPGACALDARLFGRRRLLLPDDPYHTDF